VFIPGLGQYYCGKRSRDLYTFLSFATSLYCVIRFFPASNPVDETLWPFAARTLLAVYVFASLDAYYTAREVSDGVDEQSGQNPRVAAFLNFVSFVGGYIYLRRAKRAVVISAAVIVGLGIISEMAFGDVWMDFAVEALAALLAIDAYRIQRPSLVKSTTDPLRSSAASDAVGHGVELSPRVPLGLAFAVALLYAGLVGAPLFSPDFSDVSQAETVLPTGDNNRTYANPHYGIEARIPYGWELDLSNPSYFFQAFRSEGGCRVDFYAEGALPWLGAPLRIQQFLEYMSTRKHVRFVRQEGSRVGSVPAHRLTFEGEDGDRLTTYDYFVVRRPWSFYWFTSSTYSDFSEPCQKDVENIRRSLLLPTSR
jgi:hypothetical protein